MVNSEALKFYIKIIMTMFVLRGFGDH